jgi:hypothetical protein
MLFLVAIILAAVLSLGPTEPNSRFLTSEMNTYKMQEGQKQKRAQTEAFASNK